MPLVEDLNKVVGESMFDFANEEGKEGIRIVYLNPNKNLNPEYVRELKRITTEQYHIVFLSGLHEGEWITNLDEIGKSAAARFWVKDLKRD